MVYRGAGGVINMLANGYRWPTGGYVAWSATRSEWQGEVFNPQGGDRFVGSASLPVAFSNIRHLWAGTWYSDNPAYQNPPDYTQYRRWFSLSTSAFWTWDVRN